jgi:uncharacterized protein YidB (DUF937 family)
MGLLDQVAGAVSEALSGGRASSFGRAALDLIGSPQVGGIQGLADLLQQKGLGNVVSSWIGTGENLPVSADQLKDAFGPDAIASLAQKVGISSDQAQKALSQLLPGLVDRLTPNGQIARGQDLAQAGMNALKSMLG